MTPVEHPEPDRRPLDADGLRRDLVLPGGLWTALNVVGRTSSTNEDVAAAARCGAQEGTILLAEEQAAGRGRLGRSWQSPPRAGLAISVLLRPGVSRYGWPTVPDHLLSALSLVTGVALVQAVRRVAAVDAALKWPNDLLIGPHKCAGILAELVVPPAGPASVVVGVGLNTTLGSAELPHPGATSLLLAGAACADRHRVAVAFLRDLETWYIRWRAAAGDPVRSGLLESYAEHCATIGAAVSVVLPGGGTLDGVAEAVDTQGRLVVRGADGAHTVLAVGDVVHVRPNGVQGGSGGVSGECAHQ